MSADAEDSHLVPLPEHLEIDVTESIERDMRVRRWIREWQWSQQFAPPQPLLVVTGI
jgi:hypothetical protein